LHYHKFIQCIGTNLFDVDQTLDHVWYLFRYTSFPCLILPIHLHAETLSDIQTPLGPIIYHGVLMVPTDYTSCICTSVSYILCILGMLPLFTTENFLYFLFCSGHPDSPRINHLPQCPDSPMWYLLSSSQTLYLSHPHDLFLPGTNSIRINCLRFFYT